jgi:hypothetical protein
MSDGSATKGLRERLAGNTEDRLGKALSDLFENPLLNGALGRASDAREKAVQAQELAMGALNLPSAADIERLTRRLRSVSQRLEGIEDGVHRIGRSLSGQPIEARLAGIEEQLRKLNRTLDGLRGGSSEGSRAAPSPSPDESRAAARPRRAAAKPSTAKRTTAKRTTAASRPAAAKRSKPAAR